jgi:hypothetical protein
MLRRVWTPTEDRRGVLDGSLGIENAVSRQVVEC